MTIDACYSRGHHMPVFLLIVGKEVEMSPIASSSGLALQRKDSQFPPPPQPGEGSGPYQEIVHNLALIDLPGKEHLQRYLLGMARSKFRWLTILQALSTLKLFASFLRDTGKGRLEEVSRRDLEAFIEREQDRGLRLSSVKAKLDRVRSFLGFLVEEEVFRPDILMRKIRLKVPQYLPRAMDPTDVGKLGSVIEETRDRAIMVVLLRTGMRIGELLAIRVSDVNIKERKITIREGAKTRRGRIVYFSDDARDALDAWLHRRDPHKEFLFYAQGRNTVCYTTARMMFEKYRNRAGLGHMRYSLHCLRHSFASELLNAGMRLECLEQLLRHDSIQVTRRYARLTDRTREQEYFRAMAIIERGEINGTYRLDHKLQAILEEKKGLNPCGQNLYGEAQAVSPVAGCAD